MQFIDYLMGQFAENCMCVKDDFEESFELWLEDLDGEDYIEYGNEYGEQMEVLIHARYNETAKKLFPNFNQS